MAKKSKSENVLRDPDSVYQATSRQQGTISHWLGLSDAVSRKLLTSFDLIRLSRKGLTKQSIDQLTMYMGTTKQYMAEEVFDISVKTMERKAPGENLDQKMSAHAIEIARLLEHAWSVFEDEQKISTWLNTDNKALNNQRPVTFLNTLTGLNMVNDVLGRIEEGIYS